MSRQIPSAPRARHAGHFRHPLRLLLALALLLATAPLAWAGGDGYEEGDEVGGDGPAFFGVVRDSRGIGVSDVEVVLQPRQGLAVTLRTNLLGLYRGHAGKDVVATEVTVTCVKPGYRPADAVRRGQGSTTRVEANCTLQRL